MITMKIGAIKVKEDGEKCDKGLVLSHVVDHEPQERGCLSFIKKTMRMGTRLSSDLILHMAKRPILSRDLFDLG